MRRRGSTAVEFALTIPLLLVFLAGVLDIGQFLFVADQLVSTVGESAHAAAIQLPWSPHTPEQVAHTMAQRVWDSTGLPGEPDVVVEIGLVDGYESVTVTATIPFVPVFDFIAMPQTISRSQTLRRYGS